MIIELSVALATAMLSLAPASTSATPNDGWAAAARDYVALQLAIGEKEAGYIDAYYGPPELQAAGKALAAREDLPALRSRADALSARVARLTSAATPEFQRRGRFLQAQLTAARTRLRMLQGEKLSFDDEAEGLFAVRPQLKPLASFDPALARIEKLVPGNGPLSDRVEAFQNRFTIPSARLARIFRASIAECRARTVRHIPLPAGERFELGFVTGKSWSGYNYYKGGYISRIEVNTDLPVRISRAVDLGCHEGYPGHHALNVLLEQRLVRGRGWVEFSVYPLYSPQSLIAEGTANYGADLAFPDQLAFERATLYPLAGLPKAEARRYSELLSAMDALGGARMTIAREQLDGRIGEEQAVELTRKYQLVSEARARQLVAFTREYRSYVINYGLGEEMVRADVEQLRTPAERWKRFEQLISEPTLPSDLKRR